MAFILRRAVLVGIVLQLLPWSSRVDLRTAAAKEQSPAAAEFSERVGRYTELRRRLESLQPPQRETHNPEEITARRHALADAIRHARPNAAPGEIFTPAVAEYFRRIIQADVRQTGTKVVGVAPVEKPEVALRVNDEYPDHQPLSSVPPLLLSQLPPLPPELEYRFVGQHLLLLDRTANVIVDFFLYATPANR